MAIWWMAFVPGRAASSEVTPPPLGPPREVNERFPGGRRKMLAEMNTADTDGGEPLT
jgi:hypothetical protein